MKNFLLNIPAAGRIILFFYRMIKTYKYVSGIVKHYVKWLFVSRETTNFIYELNKKNKNYLAALLANITGKSINEIIDYINEIESDQELINHFRMMISKSTESGKTDYNFKYGRRVGWYALVRILKPKIIIETGVDKGMGSCVLTSALIKNKSEGFEGYYYGTDINLKAGYLFDGIYKNHGEILYGDSIETLKKFERKIDLFINDSDHSSDYEYQEYLTIKEKLSDNAVILGDNSHYSDKLYKFSIENGRQFLFFKEEPLNHWYPGAGIGISFTR